MYDILELNAKLVTDLKEIATALNIPNTEGLKKQELIYKILDHQALSPSKDEKRVEFHAHAGRPPKKGPPITSLMLPLEENPLSKSQSVRNPF